MALKACDKCGLKFKVHKKRRNRSDCPDPGCEGKLQRMRCSVCGTTRHVTYREERLEHIPYCRRCLECSSSSQP